MRAAFFLLLLAVAAPNREDPTPKEKPATPAQLLIGDWQLEKLVYGTTVDDRTKSNHVLRITPTETHFVVNGKVSEGDGFTAVYTIDVTKTPIVFDLAPKSRAGKMPGIILLDGDRMTFAISTTGGTRPNNFTNAEMVGYYRRIK